MENRKSLKEIVTKNCETVKELMDYAESFEKEFKSKIESEGTLPTYEKLYFAMRISEIAKSMDSCESLFKTTLMAITMADLDVEGDDVDQCLQMYIVTTNQYQAFKEAAYKTILDEEYLKAAFKENN